MVQLWRAFGHLVPLFLGIILAVTVILYFIYRYNKKIKIKIVLVNILLALSILAIYLVTIETGTYRAEIPRVVNLVPFVGMYEIIVHSVHYSVIINNLILNIVLFMPFGFFMTIRMSRKKQAILKTLLLGLLLSLLVEMFQYVLPIDRAADIDDIILNTLGTFLGGVIGKVLHRKFPNFFGLSFT